MTEVPTIHGGTDEGFGAVVDAFRRNFSYGGEVGAALAVYQGDRLIVDLWAGFQDREHSIPWHRDTIVPVYSATKGMAALTIAAAVSAGLLAYDQSVASYWPEFGKHGKDQVTVRQLLDHQAGLFAIDERLSVDDLTDLDRLATILARQKPAWPPGTRHGYHSISLGLYLVELIRRVDPARRTLGRYFADEIAGPLGLDFFIGLPTDFDLKRIAPLLEPRVSDVAKYERDLSIRMGLDLITRGPTFQSLANPDIGRPRDAVRRDYLSVELPGTNGVGSARALARAYGAAASQSSDLRVDPSVLDHLASAHTDDQVPSQDQVLHRPSRYHLGFRKSHPTFAFGSSDQCAYGTSGLGGSFGFADPSSGIGYGYAMNRLGLAVLDDVRNRNLRTSLFAALSGERPHTSSHHGSRLS